MRTIQQLKIELGNLPPRVTGTELRHLLAIAEAVHTWCEALVSRGLVRDNPDDEVRRKAQYAVSCAELGMTQKLGSAEAAGLFGEVRP